MVFLPLSLVYCVFYPLLSAILVLLFGRFLGQYVKYFSVLNMFITLAASVVAFINIFNQPVFFQLTHGIWFKSIFLTVKWGFIYDNVSVLMILTVCLVSFCVHMYSCYYMASDPSLTRFLAYLSLFTFFMLFLLTSGNLIQFFFAWEGVGLCSYLLISFWNTRVEANRAAVKAVLVNRVGDCCLLLGICLVYSVFGTTNFSALNFLLPNIQVFYLTDFFFFEISYINLICFFFVTAAMCKSAQIGFHIWLPDAMEGPTPVSALIHAATMVTAGVFLIIRCSLFFEYSPVFLNVLLLSGSLTALLGATAALGQYDIKKVIAYSTCSQLGYMVMSCGVSRYDIAFFHLVNHAFFKAVLFLSAGVIIHTLAGEQDVRRMGGLKKKLLPIYILMLIASLALAGIPFLSGFYSKDMILGFSFISEDWGSYFGFTVCFFSAIFTSFYSAKTLNLIFFNRVNGVRKIYSSLHAADNLALIPILILGIASVCSGLILKWFITDLGSSIFSSQVFMFQEKDVLLDFEFSSVYIKFYLLLIGFSGFIYYNFPLSVNLSKLKNFDFVSLYYLFVRTRRLFFFKFYTFFSFNVGYFLPALLFALSFSTPRFNSAWSFFGFPATTTSVLIKHLVGVLEMNKSKHSVDLFSFLHFENKKDTNLVIKPSLGLAPGDIKVLEGICKINYIIFHSTFFKHIFYLCNLLLSLVVKIFSSKHKSAGSLLFNKSLPYFFLNIWYSDYLLVKLINFFYKISLQLTYFLIDKGFIYSLGPETAAYATLVLNKAFTGMHKKGSLFAYINLSLLLFFVVILISWAHRFNFF